MRQRIKKVEKILKDCWSAHAPGSLSKETVHDSMQFFMKCVEEKLSNMSEVDQMGLVSTYLYLLGYAEQEIFVRNREVIVYYKLPGSIRITGLAVLNKTANQTSAVEDGLSSSPSFFFIFNLHDQRHKANLTNDSRTLVIYLEDCIRSLGLILAIRLYRYFEVRFRQEPDLRNWFFEYMSDTWNISKDELAELENRWNTISEFG